MNFLYTIDPNADEPIMLIDKHIGYDEQDGYGVIGSDFSRELLTLDSLGKKKINIWINSPGGAVTDGYSIISAILNTKTKVDTHCMGMAASISALIYLSGRKRHMADYGFLMIHNPQGSTNSEVIKTFKDSLLKLTSGRSNKSEDELSSLMNRTTFINPSEAVEMGMCDEIVASSEANRKHMRTESIEMAWKDATLILNKVITPKINTMLKVTNKLGLNDQANEDSILTAIEKIENRAKESETLNNSLKTELEQVKNQLTEKESALNTLKQEKEAAETAKKQAEEDAKEVSAKDLVNKFTAKIGNDQEVVNLWIEDAKKDYEGTKKKLEAMPVNKTGIKIVNEVKSDVPKYTAAGLMATINNKNQN
jgi:ATP-dependent Clp protease, protease subunit